MTRPIMRRLAPLVLVLVCLLALPVSPSSAQEDPSVRLTLLSQTSWNSSYDPLHGPELELRFRAENLGTEPLGDLAIGVTLYSRILSRSAYDASLVTDPDPAIVIDGGELRRTGQIEPGRSREFEIGLVLGSGIDTDQSGLYPLKVDLRSGTSSVAELRTPVIFLVREPEEPLDLSWTFVLHHPITFAPDGTFTDPSLELALGPGGRLHGEIRSLRTLAADPTGPHVDVAVSPVLLTQLGRMRDGYTMSDGEMLREVAAGMGGAALADRAILDLQTIAQAPNVHITALPFSTPELPALYDGGLGRDAELQLEHGRNVVAEFLRTSPIPQVLRPPGAALDDTTLRNLTLSDITTLLVDPATVTPVAQPLGFAGPATTGLAEGALSAIVPEPGADALVTATAAADPVRAVQVMLGELATIWQEQPGEERGIAVVLDEDAPFPGPFFPPFAASVADAPWLSPLAATEFVNAYPPVASQPLALQSSRRFSTSYVTSLKQARRRVETLASMLPGDSTSPERLDAMLLLAEARQFLAESDEGIEFISSVHRTVQDVMNSLVVDTVPSVTFSSEQGRIPITVSNNADEALAFSVRLKSESLRSSSTADMELPPGASETVRLQAEMRSTGRALIDVHLLSPSGRVIEHQAIVVRSTGYNRIALLITIGAAVLMIVAWARRFLPRRTS
ncbi:MAG TPA: DUF6049 family protein [Actinomycetota bacterium]|nr:DUF6049 family protein [Actinomycetota bacterium]